MVLLLTIKSRGSLNWPLNYIRLRIKLILISNTSTLFVGYFSHSRSIHALKPVHSCGVREEVLLVAVALLLASEARRRLRPVRLALPERLLLATLLATVTRQRDYADRAGAGAVATRHAVHAALGGVARLVQQTLAEEVVDERGGRARQHVVYVLRELGHARRGFLSLGLLQRWVIAIRKKKKIQLPNTLLIIYLLSNWRHQWLR